MSAFPVVRSRVLTALAALVAVVVGATTAMAAPADPPGTISYQGVLLDNLGQPRTGNVDLTIRIYDGLAGGTLLYKQIYLATPLTDGTFTLAIGPAGAATDTPVDPLTTNLADVFSGDLVAGPDRFAELSVDVDPALARIQILSSPLALRAESAATADTATTATTALDVTTVNGLSAAALTEIYEHFNFDGGLPNDDPAEGLGDTDLDGIANFVDPDNDGDTISDIDELAAGSDINLITPQVQSATPNTIAFGQSDTVTVAGTSFEPGITVVFGSETPTPSNISATSFDVTVGPQGAGPADITVTRLNGEFDTLVGGLTFGSVTTFNHLVPSASLRSFDVTGTERTLMGHSNDNYYADTDGDGVPETFFNIVGVGAADYKYDSTGQLWGFHCEGSFPCDVQFANDPNSDYQVTPAFVVAGSAAGILFDAALDFAPGDEPVALYARSQGGIVELSVVHDRDGDDLYTGTNENVLFETVTTATGKIAVDGAGRVAVAYDPTIAAVQSLRLANDLNGDGDYADTVSGVLEIRDLAAGAVDCFSLDYDGSNRLAVVYAAAGSGTATLLHDLDGNGDFLGAGESVALPGTGVTACAMSVTGGGGVAVVTNADGDTRLFRDLDLDDAFTSSLENILLGFASTNVAIAVDGDGEIHVANQTLISPNF